MIEGIGWYMYIRYYTILIYLTKRFNINGGICYFNYMVKQNEDNLNEIFHALADSTRREMVHIMDLNMAGI